MPFCTTVYLTNIWHRIFPPAAWRCEVRHQRSLLPLDWTGLDRWQLLHPFLRHHTCLYMRRGEKPEGYRQMRPKTFPASNYSGNSQQQMLQEIRNSLRNLSKPSDPPKVDAGGQGKLFPDDAKQQGRTSSQKHPYQKALQEIRKSLVPFEVNGSLSNESNISGPDINKQTCLESSYAGFEEVSFFFLPLLSTFFSWRIVTGSHSVHTRVIEGNHLVHFV